MVRALIGQLSQNCIRIPAALESLYSSCEKEKRQPRLDDLLQVLREAILEFSASYIILDALDECNDQTQLLEILQILSGWELEHLHVLLASRKERDIECSLESFISADDTISLRMREVDNDIAIYIKHRLSNDKTLKKWGQDLKLREEIEAALMQKAQGM